MIWYYIVIAIALAATILFGSCILIDYYNYRDLQRRLREERRRKIQSEASAT